MKKYLLAICIPTFNRSTLKSNIETYLTCKDQRFYVRVQDNCSTNDIYEELKEIKDSRFVLKRNIENIGLMPNSRLVLSDCDDAEYILFCIDKDLVNVEQLPAFLDYLEQKRPAFGYVDLYNFMLDRVDVYPAGRLGLFRMGYLGKHPSGYFWNENLFAAELSKPYFKQIPLNFDFWFDIVCAHLSLLYDSVVLYIPLVLHGEKNPKFIPNKTISYNETNLYFSCPKRIETFIINLNDLNQLDVLNKLRNDEALRLFKRTMTGVTKTLRQIYHSNSMCYHYNLKWHTVSWLQMFKNSISVVRVYNKNMQKHESVLSLLIKSSIVFIYTVMSFSKNCIVELFKKPQENPFKEGDPIENYFKK